MTGYDITRLDAPSFDSAADDLGLLLADTVAGGDSLGFLAPLDPGEAAQWWRDLFPEVATGARTVWAARDPEGIAGTVSLVPAPMPNARHRAEVVKLIVHRRARGHGLGRLLLAAAEAGAAQGGCTLLVLDTETGTPADHLYRSAGWTPFGALPDYAAAADGTLRHCTFFFKRLDQHRQADTE